MNIKEMDNTQAQIDNYILGRPHVVILGAGATVAAIPNGDKNGLKSSVMNNFIEETGLSDILSKVRINTASHNLEDIYSELDSRPECSSIKKELETKIISHFSNFQLPDVPTVYDYLLISLRSKDYVLTFNWDDLLLQAYNRVRKITSDLPHLGFLHGNIGVGACPKCGYPQAYRNRICCKCEIQLYRPPLLFPVKKKDYNSDPYIKRTWEDFLKVIKEAGILTIFGYGAPKTDVEAISAMKTAFASTFRRYDQIEVIDVKPEAELWEIWHDFAQPTNFHFKTYTNLFDSLIGEFPRRSTEGYHLRNFKGWWGKSKVQLQECSDFKSLGEIMQPLIEAESSGNYEVIPSRSF